MKVHDPASTVSVQWSRMLAALDAPVSRPQAAVPVLGLSGAPGSGKSTLARAWADAGPARVVVALDDFYLPAETRRRLARRVHPWLATRGVPGTHDAARLAAVLDALVDGRPVRWPCFDKARDRHVGPDRSWPGGRPAAILVEGWCLGARRWPRTPKVPGKWLAHVDHALRRDLAAVARRFDRLVFLRAPDPLVVGDWRWQAELGRLGPHADRTTIQRFVQPMMPLVVEMIVRPPVGAVVFDLPVHRDGPVHARPGAAILPGSHSPIPRTEPPS